MLLPFLQPGLAHAQLEYVPPIHVAVYDTGRLHGILLLDTRDFHLRFGAPNHYPSTLQIIEPLRPWPPIFFANISPELKDTEGNLLQDFRYQEQIRQLTFFISIKSPKHSYTAYLFSDTHFVCLDTFADANKNIDGHDLRINAKGERLFMSVMDTLFDISGYSGKQSDTSALVTTQKIQISNSLGMLLFSWNPLEHIPISDHQQHHEQNMFTRGWDWSHGNSVSFTHDGNIIYSFRRLGVGKINRQTGKLLWKLGGKTPTLSLPEGGEFYRQHDFREIAPGIYSVLSNGDSLHPCRGIIYRIDEYSGKVTVIHTVEPQPPVFSLSLGSYQVSESNYVLNYGRYHSLDDRHSIFQMGDTSGKIYAVFSSPSLNFAYQVQHVTAWKPVRPEIINAAGTFRVRGAHTAVMWYKIDGSAAIRVSDAPEFKPREKGTYVATIKKGFGWLVSKPLMF